MTRNEITDHYNRKVSLIADLAALEKLRAYLEESTQQMNADPQGNILIEGMKKEIEDLESAIQKKAEDLEKNADAVRARLKAIPDRTSRVAASLHYCSGLSWAEVGSIIHMSDAVIRMRVSRAMQGAGILWEK